MMPTSEMTPDWDQHYREQDTPWDRGAPAPPLLEWLAANPGVIEGSILVPGSGRGHDVRALAREPKATQVVGLDLSSAAIALANQIPKVGNEEHCQGDLFTLDPAHHDSYDWVFEHTCFCAINPSQRDRYVESVVRALKAEGQFLAVFYLNPYDNEHAPNQGPPHGCSIEELEERFVGSGLFEIVESYIPGQAYPGREGLERLIRMRRK